MSWPCSPIVELSNLSGEASVVHSARGHSDGTVKEYRRGTHRSVAPGETLARLRPLLADMGITRVANVTGLDRLGLPVVMVCRPNSRSIAVSQGKGLDLEAAKASGVMEAVETYHAERISHPLVFGSYRDLHQTHPIVDIDRLPWISDSRFHHSLPMLWIEGRDLITEKTILLPFELVNANFTLPLPPGSGCFVAGTNGLASGNHRLEAICHGLAEVIERDATALWNQSDRRSVAERRLDLDSVSDSACREILDRLERADLTTAVWETTSDIGVACYHAMVVDSQRGGHFGAGAGCHPARGIALSRALTEAVQVRMTYITGARDDLAPKDYAPPALAEKERHARFLIDSQRPQRAFDDGPTCEAETFEKDLDFMLRRLRAAGIDQVIEVDLTRPDLNLPVVRVVVPGLEGPDDDESYLPGPRARAVARAVR